MKKLLGLSSILLVLAFSCARKDGVQKWNDLMLAAYEAKDYDKAYEYAQKSAALGDAAGEYWMGWWALRGERPEDCVGWFKKSAMHGNVGAQIKLGELYESGFAAIVNDYAEARRYYEMAAASGGGDEDVKAALARLPAADDYPALFALALDNDSFGPNYALAFMYAVQGGFGDADFDNPVCEPMAVHYPAACEKTATGALVDLACEQIEYWNERGYNIAGEYIDFYRSASKSKSAGENAKRMILLLERK